VTSVTRASPIRWLFNQGRQLFQRLRGEKVDRSVVPSDTIRDRFVNQDLRGVNNLATSVASGEIRTSAWVQGMRQEIKESYISQYLLAKGGVQNMTPEDWGRLGGLLKNQYQYLNGFAQELNAGQMSEAQIRQRAELYIKSSRQAYERGRVASLQMPALPAYPGDGSTQCVTNCQCHWEITETSDEWRAYWTLGAAEHCPDCVQRSKDWAPYTMNKG